MTKSPEHRAEMEARRARRDARSARSKDRPKVEAVPAAARDELARRKAEQKEKDNG